MPTFAVIDLQKRPVGSVELGSGVFDVQPDQSLVHTAVVMQQACERQGTASTRGRGEVRGSGKKPWKQKHTGRARAGSNRSPIWRHGGTVFGPRPRQYGFNMPKKMYRAALRSALSAKVSSGELLVLSALTLPEAKARHLAKILNQLGLTRKTLIVVGEEFESLERVARNLAHVGLVHPQNLNVYDILRFDQLVVLESQLPKIQELWS